ncbi:MAG TPA: MalY/PatB family protein [Bacillota bacterium]|nr:MalY/PatB family protein [Bacillota bacterium]
MDTFKHVVNRKNTRSVKWDMLKDVFHTDDVLPMWVADMDFKAPDAVNVALQKRAGHGIYGYTIVDDDLKQTIINWVKRRHNWEITSDSLSFSPGVVTSLHIAIQALTDPQDKILIQTPVYTPFYSVIESHERKIVKNPLVLEDNYYKVDFSNLEAKLKDGVKAFILCSPHNPVGRVWSSEELEKIGRLCVKYDVIMLSDEIHGDLTFPEYKHIPLASLSKEIANNTVTFMSPSKTFNLAGLQASYIITTNENMKEKIDKNLQKQGMGMLNTMGNTALEAAYEHGEKWLDKLRTHIYENYLYAAKTINEHTNRLSVTHSEGTYLLWIDCSGLGLTSDELETFMIQTAKVGLNKGIAYGEEGDQFMRLNLACPKETLTEGIQRIIQAVNKYEQSL